MTVSVRPWPEISADLRGRNGTAPLSIQNEAAVAGDALAAAMIEVRSERDTAIAKAALCNAKLAAVHTALDQLEADRNGRAMVGEGRAAIKCVSAIAKAVRR